MSSTSILLGHISAFRNPTVDAQSASCLKVVAAQCAYMVIVPYALIEAAISQIVKAISSCLNLAPAKYQKIQDWANSAACSVVWSVFCMSLNLWGVKELWPAEKDFKENMLKIHSEPVPVSTPAQLNARYVTDESVPRTRVLESFEDGDEDPFGSDNVKPFSQPATTLKPEPIPDPIPQSANAVLTSENPVIANLLDGYRLGDNAKRYSDLLERIYREIPEPDDLELYGLVTQLGILLKKRGETRTRNKIFTAFEDISEKIERKQALTVWEERLIKMTVAINSAIQKLKGDDLEAGKEILISGLLDAFENCSNRQSAEIERLYFRYVAPQLLEAAETAATPLETLIFELMQFRIRKRDDIINRLCPDAHNAASHRFFRKKLNERIFYLPTSLLSAEDEHYAGFAMQEKENAIIKEFQQVYDNPKTIYDILIGLLYHKANESFRFKPTMFIKWLEDTGRMNEDAFSDEDMTIYKPEIVIKFLQDHNILKQKGWFN